MDDAYEIGQAHGYLVKSAGKPTTTYSMAGELYLSESGWILLRVPANLVRGVFDSLRQLGAELPMKDGKLTPHISVMRPEELKQIGGPDKITERGHIFHYTLGPVQEVQPAGWKEMSKVWFVQVKSPELERLRKSYGLTAKPKNNQHDFHITVGVRRKKVFQEASGVTKHEGAKEAAQLLVDRLQRIGVADDLVPAKTAAPAKKEKVKTVAVDLDGTLATYDGWKGEEHFGRLRPHARATLKDFKAKGYRVIIHTVRGNKTKVKEWLDTHDLPYDHINENPDQPPGSSSKLSADVYLDDHAVSAKPSWLDLGKEVHQRMKTAASLDEAVDYLARYYSR